MRFISIFLVFVVGVASFPTLAEIQNANEEDIMIWDGMPLHRSCDKNQMTVNQCAADVWRTADDELNKVYQAQLQYFKETQAEYKTDGMASKRLMAAQRAWLVFRDKDCAYQVGEGGSSAAYEEFKCKYKRTLTRIKELQEYVDCRVNGCPY